MNTFIRTKTDTIDLFVKFTPTSKVIKTVKELPIDNKEKYIDFVKDKSYSDTKLYNEFVALIVGDIVKFNKEEEVNIAQRAQLDFNPKNKIASVNDIIKFSIANILNAVPDCYIEDYDIYFRNGSYSLEKLKITFRINMRDISKRSHIEKHFATGFSIPYSTISTEGLYINKVNVYVSIHDIENMKLYDEKIIDDVINYGKKIDSEKTSVPADSFQYIKKMNKCRKLTNQLTEIEQVVAKMQKEAEREKLLNVVDYVLSVGDKYSSESIEKVMSSMKCGSELFTLLTTKDPFIKSIFPLIKLNGINVKSKFFHDELLTFIRKNIIFNAHLENVQKNIKVFEEEVKDLEEAESPIDGFIVTNIEALMEHMKHFDIEKSVYHLISDSFACHSGLSNYLTINYEDPRGTYITFGFYAEVRNQIYTFLQMNVDDSTYPADCKFGGELKTATVSDMHGWVDYFDRPDREPVQIIYDSDLIEQPITNPTTSYHKTMPRFAKPMSPEETYKMMKTKPNRH